MLTCTGAVCYGYYLEGMQKEPAHKFILACQKAEDSFEEWLNCLEEADLKAHFRKLAAVRDHLHSAMEEVRAIL